MSPVVKLAGYGAVLALALAVGLGLGAVAGPIDVGDGSTGDPTHGDAGHGGWHGSP